MAADRRTMPAPTRLYSSTSRLVVSFKDYPDPPCYISHKQTDFPPPTFSFLDLIFFTALKALPLVLAFSNARVHPP